MDKQSENFQLAEIVLVISNVIRKITKFSDENRKNLSLYWIFYYHYHTYCIILLNNIQNIFLSKKIQIIFSKQ